MVIAENLIKRQQLIQNLNNELIYFIQDNTTGMNILFGLLMDSLLLVLLLLDEQQ